MTHQSKSKTTGNKEPQLSVSARHAELEGRGDKDYEMADVRQLVERRLRGYDTGSLSLDVPSFNRSLTRYLIEGLQHSEEAGAGAGAQGDGGLRDREGSGPQGKQR